MFFKTILSAIVLLSLTLNCQAQQFTITGVVKGLDGKMMRLEQRGVVTDSARVINGVFQIKGTVPDVTYCMLQSEDSSWGCMFWISNDDITIRGNEITGAPEEDAYQAYKQHMTPIWDEMRALMSQETDLQTNGKMEESRLLRKKLNTELAQKQDSAFLAFCEKYPSAYCSMNHVYNCRVLNKYSFRRYNAMLQHLTPGAFKGRQWDEFMAIRDKDLALEPGKAFPEIAMKDVYDTNVKISDYRGKYLLLWIAFGGIEDYDNYVPIRKEFERKFKNKGLEQLDIFFVENKDAIMKTVAEFDIPWNIISDFKGWGTPMAKEMGIDHLSQNFLIDPTGKIVARNVWEEELTSIVEKQF